MRDGSEASEFEAYVGPELSLTTGQLILDTVRRTPVEQSGTDQPWKKQVNCVPVFPTFQTRLLSPKPPTWIRRHYSIPNIRFWLPAKARFQ